MRRKLKAKTKLFNKVVVMGLCFALALALMPSLPSVGYADAGKDQEVGSPDNETVSGDQSNNGQGSETDRNSSNKENINKEHTQVRRGPAKGPVDPGNVLINNGLVANFMYEKKIDMRNALNRKQIPNADFDFTLSTIPRSDRSKYGINKLIGNSDEVSPYKIRAGKLGNGKSSIPFSRVSFRKTDGYDPVLTRLIDKRSDGDSVINHILKYDWGEMRSTDRSQTAIARKPTAEEEARLRNGSTADSWPDDTIAWKCPREYPDNAVNPGSIDDNCTLLWNYDFNNFNYVQEFNLHRSPAVTYYAYTYRKPLLTHRVKDRNGNYISVSKGLLAPHEYYKMCSKLHKTNNESFTYDEGAQISYRFLLREKKTGGSKLRSNNEVKIVDFIPCFFDDEAQWNSVMLIFDNIKEANNFYNKMIKLQKNGFGWGPSLNDKNIAPKASFTNRYLKAKKPTQKKPNEKNVNKPAVGSGNGDNSAGGGHPATGDTSNVAQWIILCVIACSGLGGILVYRRMRR